MSLAELYEILLYLIDMLVIWNLSCQRAEELTEIASLRMMF